jgi:hypothetical protein
MDSDFPSKADQTESMNLLCSVPETELTITERNEAQDLDSAFMDAFYPSLNPIAVAVVPDRRAVARSAVAGGSTTKPTHLPLPTLNTASYPFSEQTQVRISRTKPQTTPRAWTANEDKLLIAAIKQFGDSTGPHKKWEAVSQAIGSRNGTQCQQRWSQVMRPGLQKGLWSAHEDALLLKLVAQFGPKWPKITEHWPIASAAAGRANRTSKQIRERWSNKLDPSLSREPWSAEEDNILFNLHMQFGNSWSCVAKHLPGRVPDSVKTRFKTLNRRAKKAQRVAKISQKLKQIASASTPAGSTEPPQIKFQLQNPRNGPSIMDKICTNLRSHTAQAAQASATVNAVKNNSGFLVGGTNNFGGTMTQEDGLVSGVYHDRWGEYNVTHSSPSQIHLVEMAETPMWQPADGTLRGNLLSVNFSNARDCGGLIRGDVAPQGARITWSNGACWIKGPKPKDGSKAVDSIHDRTRYWLMHGGPDGSCDYNQITRVTLGPPRLQKRSCSVSPPVPPQRHRSRTPSTNCPSHQRQRAAHATTHGNSHGNVHAGA